VTCSSTGQVDRRAAEHRGDEGDVNDVANGDIGRRNITANAEPTS
jgi:hypothetical protein